MHQARDHYHFPPFCNVVQCIRDFIDPSEWIVRFISVSLYSYALPANGLNETSKKSSDILIYSNA